MGTVIQLPKREVSRPAMAATACEIVIFPGVRIERPQPEKRAPRQTGPRRRRRKSG
ncbi:MAG: hypothetical protein KIT43_13475 [Bauldia sp.]|nr:hypothetical protein [Bauldia sp.]MCW5716969.1 hypothetical protein [Bauldia sp.]